MGKDAGGSPCKVLAGDSVTGASPQQRAAGGGGGGSRGHARLPSQVFGEGARAETSVNRGASHASVWGQQCQENSEPSGHRPGVLWDP